MAFDLKSIQKSTQLPPRIVCYGVPGIGKTTFAAHMPDPVFLPIEDGLGQLEVPAFPRPDTFEQVMTAIESLQDEHSFGTLVIDSLDKLEPILWDYITRTVPHEKGHLVQSIEDYGYGKGYTHALTSGWRPFLSLLDVLREDWGMGICLIAHSHIVRFESPEHDPFDRYQLRLHKHAVGAVCDWADAVLFANYDMVTVDSKNSEKKRGIGKGERSLFTTERPAFTAKNRYGMSDKLPLSWEAVDSFIDRPPNTVAENLQRMASKKK